MAYNNGRPSAVLFAGEQKQTAMVSSGGRDFKTGWNQRWLRRNLGGRELKKDMPVRAT
jgi:hypothetical protein